MELEKGLLKKHADLVARIDPSTLVITPSRGKKRTFKNWCMSKAEIDAGIGGFDFHFFKGLDPTGRFAVLYGDHYELKNSILVSVDDGHSFSTWEEIRWSPKGDYLVTFEPLGMNGPSLMFYSCPSDHPRCVRVLEEAKASYTEARWLNDYRAEISAVEVTYGGSLKSKKHRFDCRCTNSKCRCERKVLADSKSR